MATVRFSCDAPACRKPQSFESGAFPREYAGGEPYACPHCRHAGLKPHYCPRCAGVYEFPRETQGGRRVNCPCGHKFTVPVAGEAEVVARLQGMRVRRLGRYVQSARIKQLPDAVPSDRGIKDAVSGGYCAGAVLDWVRRALLGPPTAAGQPRTTYKDPDQKPSGQTDRRAAVAWIAQERHRVRDNLEKTVANAKSQLGRISEGIRLEREMAEHNARHAAIYAEYSRRFDEFEARSREVSADREAVARARTLLTEGEQMLARSKAERPAAAAAIQKGHDDRIAALDAPGDALAARTRTERYWTDFSRLMDALLERDRVARQKPAGSLARPFSDLTIARSTGGTTYKAGLPALFAAVLDDDAFLGNRAAAVGIDAHGTKSGHAIGILLLPSGLYHMFDPNFGTFEASRANLLEALVYLFRTAYPNWPSADAADNHPYEDEAGSAAGNYTIFVGSQSAVPVVQARTLAMPGAAEAAAVGTVSRLTPSLTH